MRVTFKLPVVLVLGLTLSACSMFGHKRESIDTMTVEKLYAKGHNDVVNGDYAAASKAYQRLIARFPSGEYNEQAQLDLAYSQYKDNQPDDAY